jgi:LCP family protein required for cell wall assembly
MDRKQHRPRSVDGIYQPHRPVVRKAPQANYLARPPVKSADTTPPPTQPKLTLHSDNPSLLNTTLVPRSFQPVEDPRRKNGKRPKHRAGWSGWSRKRKIVTSTLALLLIGFSLGGWYGARLIGNLDKAFHGNVFSDAQALFSQVKLNGETQGRVNILIAFMLSIPRDLWVNIPGLGNQKINAANDVTNFSAAGYPSGGMGQLEQIVQTDLGIPIDYDALVNYDAFKDAVNAVGGITVDIQSPDPRGLYDSNTNLNLPNGEDTLNGQTALNLARARGDNDGDISYGFPDTDFDRTQHQRQMVVAIAKKATTLGVLANPLKVNQLFAAVANNVQTDLTLQDALRLAQIGKGINLNTIGSYTYSSSTTGQTSPLLVGYTDPDSGEDSLAPSAGVGNFGQLQQYYQQLTSTNPVVKEGASVVVLNGSDVIGLAKQEEGVLQTKGVDTVTIADANNEYPSTMIVDNSAGKDPATKQLLEQLYPGTTVTTDTGSLEAGEAQGYTSNFVVVLGKNWDSTPNQ